MLTLRKKPEVLTFPISGKQLVILWASEDSNEAPSPYIYLRSVALGIYDIEYEKVAVSNNIYFHPERRTIAIPESLRSQQDLGINFYWKKGTVSAASLDGMLNLLASKEILGSSGKNQIKSGYSNTVYVEELIAALHRMKDTESNLVQKTPKEILQSLQDKAENLCKTISEIDVVLAEKAEMEAKLTEITHRSYLLHQKKQALESTVKSLASSIVTTSF